VQSGHPNFENVAAPKAKTMLKINRHAFLFKHAVQKPQNRLAIAGFCVLVGGLTLMQQSLSCINETAAKSSRQRRKLHYVKLAVSGQKATWTGQKNDGQLALGQKTTSL